MKRTWLFGNTVILLVFLGLILREITRAKNSRQTPVHKGYFFVRDYPISPLANDVWIKEDKNRYLRYQTNAGMNEIESYDLDRDPSELISISPDYVVGNFQTQQYHPVFVSGKLNPSGSVQFEGGAKLELFSYEYQNFISSFGEGLFCCFVEGYWPGEGGAHEIVSIQLSLASELPKFEVKSRLQFADTYGPGFLYQATQKNTMVFVDSTKEYVNKKAKSSTRLTVVNVSKDGTLSGESIALFEGSFNNLDTAFWADLSEDGRWIATTETTDKVNEGGEYICSVVLSQNEGGRVVNRYEKRFNFKPSIAGAYPYPLRIPIRFDSNSSFILATPVGFGRLDFIEQGKSPDLSKLKINPYLSPLGDLREDGFACFSGIVQRNGSWFAVRQVDIMKGGRRMLRRADSLIKIK